MCKSDPKRLLSTHLSPAPSPAIYNAGLPQSLKIMESPEIGKRKIPGPKICSLQWLFSVSTCTNKSLKRNHPNNCRVFETWTLKSEAAKCIFLVSIFGNVSKLSKLQCKQTACTVQRV